MKKIKIESILGKSGKVEKIAWGEHVELKKKMRPEHREDGFLERQGKVQGAGKRKITQCAGEAESRFLKNVRCCRKVQKEISNKL